jgi:CTP:molybdopterin cytidylyltransferase MocA
VSVAGIILAAGESRRMGFPKALLRYREENFLDTLIGLFAARCQPVIVVLGAHSDRIRAHTLRTATFVINADYQRGQTSSMQCGLRAVPPGADGVLFTLVDHPAVAPATLDALLGGRLQTLSLTRISHTPPANVAQGVPSGPVPAVSRLVSTPVRGRDTGSEASVGMSADAAGRSACATSYLLRVPRHQGRRGHPIWFSRDLIAEFLGLPAFGAAREIVRAHAAQTEFLDVDDPGILADIDDAAAYGRLTGAAL